MRTLVRTIPKIVPKIVKPGPVYAKPVGQYLETKRFVQNDNSDKAAKPYYTTSKRPDDPYLHSIRIKQMAMKGDLERALQYFDQKLSDKRIPYNTVVFNTVIDVLGHAGRFRQAERVYEEMRRRAVQPDHFTFSSLLMALAKNEDEDLRRETAEAALRLYEMAVGLGHGTVSVFNNMLTAMCKVATPEQLRQLFPPDMTDPRPDKYTFAILLRHLKREPLEQWMPYYERLLKDGVPIDGPLMTALLLCVRLGRPPVEFARPFLEMIGKKMAVEPFTRPTRPSHSLFMDVLRVSGRHLDAVNHYTNHVKPSMDSANVDPVIVWCLWRALIKLGNGQAVLSEFERLRRDLYYRASAHDMMAIVEASCLLKRFKCVVSYLDGYVVNGKVEPTAELLAMVRRVEEPEIRAYLNSTLLPFVEHKYPAVSLEYKQYTSM